MSSAIPPLRPSTHIPTPDDLISSAESLVPLLVAQQAETEERGYYSAEIHDRFERAGLYRALLPRRYGGYEYDLDCFFRIVMQVARGCPSSGWMFCLGTHHAVTVASLFGERGQDEMLGGGHFIAPSASDIGGTGRRAPGDDGWIVRGTFRYCSGMPYATYFLGHVDIAEDAEDGIRPMYFATPRENVSVVDDSWGNTLGMRGTGSYTVVLDDVFVPDHLALPGRDELSFDPAEGTPGFALHGDPLYGGYVHSSYMLQMAAVATGIAMGALEEYDRLMATKSSPYLPTPRREDPDYQRWYGRAVSRVTTCQLAIRGWAQRWHEIAGPANADPAEDLRLGAAADVIIAIAWDAVDDLFRTAGPSSLARGSRLERIYRDFSTLRTHSGLSSGAVAGQENLARRRFGLPRIDGSWTGDYPKGEEPILRP